jgi:cobalt-zinc-cadmium efflux system membrane fusion protein
MKPALPLAGLVLWAALLPGCSRKEPSASSQHVSTFKVEGGKIEFVENAPQLGFLKVGPVNERKAVASGLTGRLAWNDDVTSRFSPPVSGRVVEILAHPGQRVSAGDVLARVRSPDFGQVQADARKAAAELQHAERSLKRVRELLENRVAAAKDVETAEADYARALSERERTGALLSLYGAGDTGGIDGLVALRAPVDGVVVERNITPGQEVRADQTAERPLFVISDPSRLWLYLDVTATEAATMHAGQEVFVQARAVPDQVFRGRLEVVGEGLDPATRTIKARCVIDNSGKQLRAEMYVNAEVAADAVAGVEIPATAVFLKANTRYVFVEAAPGRFSRRAVKVGAAGNGQSVIMEGLAAGERVVIDGVLLLEAMLEGENS